MGSWVNHDKGGDFTKLELAEGETFEGIYLGGVDRIGSNGPFVAHNFQVEDADEDAKPLSATGASLNNQFADVAAGSRIRLTYKGMVVTKSKRTCKDYEVRVYVEDAGKGQAV